MAQSLKAAEAANASLLEELAALKAELATAKAANARTLTLRPSKAGALSLYGMGRWPVTLYPSQWETVLGMADAIRQAIMVGQGLDAFAASKADKVERSEEEHAAILAAFAAGMAKASKA